MIKIFFILILILSSACTKAQSQRPGDAWISSDVYGSPLVIRTEARLAGAIGSLIYRGVEYINDYDHGRQLQSGETFDIMDGCHNPTEAGSEADGIGMNSSSRLLFMRILPRYLITINRPAQWSNCGIYSGDTISKQVIIGYKGLQNIIEYQVTFHISIPHSSVVFEALTGYMPITFNHYFTFTGFIGDIHEVPFPSTSGIEGIPSHEPWILATEDGMNAMGAYSPDHPDYYGGFKIPQGDSPTAKWNIVFSRGATPYGDYVFRNFIAIGTLDEVQYSLKILRRGIYEKDIIRR